MFAKKVSLAVAALFASAVMAQATTITTFDTSTITSADGADLRANRTQAVGDAGLKVFSEQSDVTIGERGIAVDYLVGTNIMTGVATEGNNELGAGEGALLGAGTYNSYLIHFDPKTVKSTAAYTASISNIVVDFGETIVGIIVSNYGVATLLDASDDIFGGAGTLYDGTGGTGDGTEKGRRTENGDSFELVSATAINLLSLTTTGRHVDNIRILTAAEVPAVPVPASLPLLAAGLGGLAFLRRRKTA